MVGPLEQRTLTFIPADPPRHSYFAAWDESSPGGLGADTSIDVDLVLPATRGTTRTMVAAEPLAMAEAVDLLTPLSRSDEASPTAHAWARVVRAALSLIAEARVLPWVSPDGWDTWRVDPVDGADHDLLAGLADALPPVAHATPVEGRRRISDPMFAVRSVCDAVADTFIRTPAAHRVGPLRLFADREPTRVPQLRPWVHDLAVAHCATARLVLRMVPPPESQPTLAPVDGAIEPVGDWTIRFQLQSKIDPSLVVDAEEFWQSPAEVLERFGAQAETVLLIGLRTAGRLVPALSSVLDELTPTTATVADADIEDLLDAITALADADVEVRWPTELVAPRIERRLLISAGTGAAGTPASGLAPLLQLDTLLDVDWEFLLDGSALTAEELRVLSTAKRSVVSLRGRWVRLDRETLDRLRATPPELTPTTALALALGAEVDLPDLVSGHDQVLADGETIEIRAVGSFDDLVAEVQALARDREQIEPVALHATLRCYQRRGLAWMSDLVGLGLGGCLADDMGLGKTVQVLALHAHLRAERERNGRRGEQCPMLVVCPTSLMHNWQREAARFLPDVPVRVFHGPNRTLDQVADDEIVITSYGVVRTDSTSLDGVPWSVVVADEAQQVKNPRSRTARALREINSGVRLALTGTPIENKLSELWSIYDWAVPGLLGPLDTFRRTTALPIERDNDRRATRGLQQLLAPFLLRRHKTDPGIAPELPPKIERDVVVPLTGEQVTLYRAAVEASLDDVAAAEGIARRGLVLKLLTNLKQITNHPAHYLGEAGPLAGRSGKLEALDELMAAARANRESAIVFSQYVAMGRLLVAHLDDGGYRTALLHGGLSVNARQELVDRLESGALDALVLSLKAGGTGLNLTRATHVVHFDRWWNPAVEDQATDRAYRIGQDRTVTVHRIITQGTVEDRVATLLAAKRQLAAAVTAGGESWIGDLDDHELADLVSLSTPAPVPAGVGV